MKIEVFKEPNRHFASFKKDGIYIILPMSDQTYLDSMIRILDGYFCWKFELSSFSFGNHCIDVPNSEIGITPNTSDFLKEIESYYPQDLEFFIWHPEVFEGKYYDQESN